MNNYAASRLVDKTRVHYRGIQPLWAKGQKKKIAYFIK